MHENVAASGVFPFVFVITRFDSHIYNNDSVRVCLLFDEPNRPSNVINMAWRTIDPEITLGSVQSDQRRRVQISVDSAHCVCSADIHTALTTNLVLAWTPEF